MIADVDPDFYAKFAEWFVKDIEGDAELAGSTPEQALDFAWYNNCLDKVLGLPDSGESFREFYSRNFVPLKDPKGTGWWTVVHTSGSPSRQS